MSTQLVEKLELNTYRYLREVLVKEGELVSKGEPMLKYTNGTYLYAPYDLVVKAINVGETGDICRASHFIEVMDTINLRVTLNIDESELNSVETGQEVTVKLNAFDNKTYTGTITKIHGIGNYSASGSSFEIIVSFENDGETNIGMSAYCTITIDKAENVLAVPVTAVQRKGFESYVFVVSENGQIEERKVETGLSNSVYVEIKSGLELGEVVQYTDSSSNNNNSRGGAGMSTNFGMPIRREL